MTCFRILLLLAASASPGIAADRPNVLWLTCEDAGPHLGCYGDQYAITPHLDEFAAAACRYDFCWSNAPVCAPARTALITGMYPTSLGGEHMRSLVPLPRDVQPYPAYLREAGYYCTNNSKEDYNVITPQSPWNESNSTAHWKHRAAGQPFFAIFNFTISHESQIRNAINEADRVHDPAGVRVPAYHPDRPEVRKDWAQYYDRVTMMDREFGEQLAELAAAGLADDSIVFFYGDHGSGMPRSKRSACDSGLHVPLLVHIPEKWRQLASPDFRAGQSSARLVSFVDFAPTLLSLCGVAPPAHMQGRAFLGEHAVEPREFVFGGRGRMDERIDMVRCVSDGRYVYVRNYMPHLPHGQHTAYMFETPTTRVWKEMFDAGQLNEAQSRFWQPKEPEELYDLESDPDEVHNLAASPDDANTRDRLRAALHAHVREIRDVGFISEDHRSRFEGQSIYDVVHDNDFYAAADFDAIAIDATDPAHPGRLATAVSPDIKSARFRDLLSYWAALGALARGRTAVEQLHARLHDLMLGHSENRSAPAPAPASATRIAAAQALALYGSEEDVARALPVLLDLANVQQHGVHSAIAALNAIDSLDQRAAPLRSEIAGLPRESPAVPDRMQSYVGRLIDDILADLP